MPLEFPARPTLPDLNSPGTYNARVLDSFTWCFEDMPDYLEGLSAADFFQVQSSPTDTTAGRVLLNAAHGLGNTGDLANLGDWNATDKGSGLFLFSVSTANLASKPPAYVDGNFGVVRIDRYSASYFIQTCWRVSGDALPFMRRYQGGAWTAWERLYVGSSVLGTVSQSAGLVTGALIERGNNANGYFRRFACGKMECWHVKAASSGGAASWTFPGGAFIEAPVVECTAISTVSASAQLDAAPSTTAATYSVRDKTDARRADTVHLRAVGRWSTLT